MKKHPSDSSEQQHAEGWLVEAFSKKLGVQMTSRRWQLEEGSWTELDAYSTSPPILCEVWAHVGPPKGGQKHKVMTDAFKLLFVSSLVGSSARRILLFGDQEAAAYFRGESWMARALTQYGIEVEVVEFPPQLRESIIEAQERQYR